MIISETSFEQAVEEFKMFLAENNLSTELLWIFVEDTFSRNTKFYETHFWLKLPLPDENEKLAKRQYEIGKQRNLGMGLSAFAICKDKICCALIIPIDKEDSEILLMSSKYLKFSFINDMPTAEVIKGSFQWNLLRFLPFKYKKGNFLVYLQSKKDLQF